MNSLSKIKVVSFFFIKQCFTKLRHFNVLATAITTLILVILSTVPNGSILKAQIWQGTKRFYFYCKIELHVVIVEVVRKLACAGLQITVGHWILADKNWLVSDEIPPVFRHYVRRILR